MMPYIKNSISLCYYYADLIKGCSFLYRLWMLDRALYAYEFGLTNRSDAWDKLRNLILSK